jgi:lipopolysaccharide export LptBFGC system permease protein LptF
MIQLMCANYFIQATLGFILSCVLRLHVNNNNQLNVGEWLMHRLLTIPLLVPTTIVMMGGVAYESMFQYSTVISIIPAGIVSLYILTKVLKKFL